MDKNSQSEGTSLLHALGPIGRFGKIVVREVANFAALLVRGPDNHVEGKKWQRNPAIKSAPEHGSQADEPDVQRQRKWDVVKAERAREAQKRNEAREREERTYDRARNFTRSR